MEREMHYLNEERIDKIWIFRKTRFLKGVLTHDSKIKISNLKKKKTKVRQNMRAFEILKN